MRYDWSVMICRHKVEFKVSRLCAVVLLLLCCCPLRAQQVGLAGAHMSSPVVISTYGKTFSNPSVNSTAGSNLYRHQDIYGNSCLVVSGYGRPFITNPNLYDHVVVAVNKCPKPITIEACYFQTRNCVTIDVSGSQRKEAILGIQTGTKDFVFEFREKS